MSLGYKPIMVIGFLIEFTGTPAVCGEQGKHSPVSEQTQSYMCMSACWRRENVSQEDSLLLLFYHLSAHYTRQVHRH